jgi:hypothetical protein
VSTLLLTPGSASIQRRNQVSTVNARVTVENESAFSNKQRKVNQLSAKSNAKRNSAFSKKQ